MCFTDFKRSTERDGEKTFEYYKNSRLDGLLKLEVAAEYIREHYEYRQNRYACCVHRNSLEFPRNMDSKLIDWILFSNCCRFLVFREFVMDKDGNKKLIVRGLQWGRRKLFNYFNKSKVFLLLIYLLSSFRFSCSMPNLLQRKSLNDFDETTAFHFTRIF